MLARAVDRAGDEVFVLLLLLLLLLRLPLFLLGGVAFAVTLWDRLQLQRELDLLELWRGLEVGKLWEFLTGGTGLKVAVVEAEGGRIGPNQGFGDLEVEGRLLRGKGEGDLLDALRGGLG